MQSLEDKQAWVNRLKKIAGQVHGLHNMVEADRSCIDTMTQISSIKAALHQLGVKINGTYLRAEVQNIIELDNFDQSDEHIEQLISVLVSSCK